MSNEIIDLSPKIINYVVILLCSFIIINIAMDLIFNSKVDFDNLKWMIVAVIFMKL